MEPDALAGTLARRLVRAIAGRDGPGPVLFLADSGDPLGEYLYRRLMEGGTEIVRDTSRPEDCRGVVLARLTPRRVCEIWAGACRDETGEAVFRALLAGRPVWTPQEGGFWTNLPRSGLGAQVRERLQALRRAGLELLPAEEVLRRAAGEEREGRGR